MSRDHDEVVKRPERVVILDADDPMTEVHGEFVWLEEHERVLDDVRQRAFAEGYDAGRRDAAAQPTAVQVTMRRRRGPVGKLLVVLIALAAVAILLAVPVLVFGG